MQSIKIGKLDSARPAKPRPSSARRADCCRAGARTPEAAVRRNRVAGGGSPRPGSPAPARHGGRVLKWERRACWLRL